jgi:hypothetical protein
VGLLLTWWWTGGHERYALLLYPLYSFFEILYSDSALLVQLDCMRCMCQSLGMAQQAYHIRGCLESQAYEYGSVFYKERT